MVGLGTNFQGGCLGCAVWNPSKVGVSGGCDIEQAKLGAVQDVVIKISCAMAIRKGRPYLDEVR